MLTKYLALPLWIFLAVSASPQNVFAEDFSESADKSFNSDQPENEFDEEDDSGDEDDDEQSHTLEFDRGQLRYNLAEEGAISINIGVEYYSANFLYDGEDYLRGDFNEDIDYGSFKARRYDETRYSFLAVYGINENFQLSLELPIVNRVFDKDRADNSSRLGDSTSSVVLTDPVFGFGYFDELFDGGGFVFADLGFTLPVHTNIEPFDRGDGEEFFNIAVDLEIADGFGMQTIAGLNYQNLDNALDVSVGAGFYLEYHNTIVSLVPSASRTVLAQTDLDQVYFYSAELAIDTEIGDGFYLSVYLAADLSGEENGKTVGLQITY